MDGMLQITTETTSRLIRVLVGVVFMTAGILKLSDPRAFSESLRTMVGIPPSTHSLIVAIIPPGELLLGIALLVSKARIFTIVALALNFGFLVLLSYNVLYGNPGAKCGCFGDTLPDEISAITILRQATIVFLNAVAVWAVFRIRNPRRLSLRGSKPSGAEVW